MAESWTSWDVVLMSVTGSLGVRGRRVALVAAAAVGLLAVGQRVSAAPSELAPKRLKLVQHARGEADARQARGELKASRISGNGISYHGGPILTGATNV